MPHAIRGQAKVCSDCDRVEAADGIRRRAEEFVHRATNAAVTHGICVSRAARAA